MCASQYLHVEVDVQRFCHTGVVHCALFGWVDGRDVVELFVGDLPESTWQLQLGGRLAIALGEVMPPSQPRLF